MSTTRGTVERKKEEGKEIKNEATRHFGPAFQFGGWKRGGKGKAVVSSFFALFVCHTESYEFFSPISTFHPPFPVPLFKPSPLLRIKRSRGFQRGHTRQTHYFCTPRFVFWYHGRGWVVVASKREPRYVFFPLAFSARFPSLSFSFFFFWDRWKLTFRRRVWCCNSVTGENFSVRDANLDEKLKLKN